MAAYGGYFNPQFWTLPSIGVLFFPYLAMATLAVSATWLICRKYVIGCIGIGVLFLCGPTFTAALPFRFGNSPTDKENTFKMVTYNCLHLEDSQYPDLPYNRTLNFLINSGADFICLQELYGFDYNGASKNFKSQVDSLRKIYPYISREGHKEEMFLSKFPFEEKSVNLGDVKYGNMGVFELDVDGRKLTVINVHLSSYLLSEDERNVITEAKSREGMKKSIKEIEGSVYQKMRNAFIERSKIAKLIADYADHIGGNVIVCGDFNDVPGSWTYRCFTKAGFEDAYAETGFGHIITYNQHLMLFHIDQILYRGDLVPLYVRKERLKTSDHYPLIAEFEFI